MQLEGDGSAEYLVSAGGNKSSIGGIVAGKLRPVYVCCSLE